MGVSSWTEPSEDARLREMCGRGPAAPLGHTRPVTPCLLPTYLHPRSYRGTPAAPGATHAVRLVGCRWHQAAVPALPGTSPAPCGCCTHIPPVTLQPCQRAEAAPGKGEEEETGRKANTPQRAAVVAAGPVGRLILGT